MNSSISHRGPDDDGYFSRPGVVLGHRRLSIIDLTTGEQPKSNASGTVTVVFNGEIYNFQELTRELKACGYEFRTRSDTEAIIHAWSEWGVRCVEKFNGMFALAIFDEDRQSLFLARDPLGIKPLFYTYGEDATIYFGSELKVLESTPGFSGRVDHSAIEDYLAFGYIPDPKTIFSDIRKLEPGQRLLHVKGQKTAVLDFYWDVKYSTQSRISATDAAEELVARLGRSVESQLVSDVPLGAFLSGGVDSSTIVSLMAGASTEAVKTCSIGFDDPSHDESSYASAVASMYKTDHYTEVVAADMYDSIDRLAYHYDEPFADSSALPTFKVCEVARRNVKVALSGDGGDELFYGYRRHIWQRNLNEFRRFVPAAIRKPVFGIAGAMYPKMDWAPKFLRAKASFQAASRDSLAGYFHGVSLLPEKLRFDLYSEKMVSSLQGYTGMEVFARYGKRIDSEDPFDQMQYLDLKTYLPGDILTKVDRASMAYGLEVRVPFLDHEFVDWAVRVRGRSQVSKSAGKLLLKDCVRSRLPSGITDRRKMGFSVPLAKWLRGPLRGEVEQLVGNSFVSDCGLFDGAVLAAVGHQHLSGSRDHSDCLWSLIMLERFLQRYSPAL